uniref:Gag-pol protein n=1 Tax=Solanum tuberosum TaxID=4113 RepID=M1CEJ0_SOLTU
MILSVGVGPFPTLQTRFIFKKKLVVLLKLLVVLLIVVLKFLVDLGHDLVVILLLEPLRLRGFRVGKKQGEKVEFLEEKGWAVTPANAPQKGTLNFPLRGKRLAERPAGLSEV